MEELKKEIEQLRLDNTKLGQYAKLLEWTVGILNEGQLKRYMAKQAELLGD